MPFSITLKYRMHVVMNVEAHKSVQFAVEKLANLKRVVIPGQAIIALEVFILQKKAVCYRPRYNLRGGFPFFRIKADPCQGVSFRQDKPIQFNRPITKRN